MPYGFSKKGDDGKKEFTKIIDHLITNPRSYCDGVDPSRDLYVYTDDRFFDSHIVRAVELIKTGKINLDDIKFLIAREFSICKAIPSMDARDYVSDFLRIISKETDDLELQKTAIEEHLIILLSGSHYARSFSKRNDDDMMRNARKYASRGLKIIETTTEHQIDPDIHAELLLAMGNTFSRMDTPSDPQLGDAIEYFLKALDLKQKAQNYADVEQLRELIHKMISFLLGLNMPMLIGQGATLRNLETALKAAHKLSDDELIHVATVSLCEQYSNVGQPKLAEDLARKHLQSNLSHEQKYLTKIVLASSLSEQGKAKEAAEIQESLISQGGNFLSDPIVSGGLWLNLGNSRKEINDFSGAQEAFETALNMSSKIENAGTKQQMQSQLYALIGEILFLQDKPEQGLKELEKAESMLPEIDPGGTHNLYFYSLAHRCFLRTKMYDLAITYCEKAKQNLHRQLSHGPAIDVWESMLTTWNQLDAHLVELNLMKGDDDSIKNALVAAEAAKGRLLSWIYRWKEQEAPEWALSNVRTSDALKKVRTWVANGKNKFVLSLFAHKNGLAVIVLGKGGSISGKWIKEISYDTFLKDHFEPWEKKVGYAMSYDDPQSWKEANDKTEYFLDRIGEWFVNVCPLLAEGGDDLVLIPHRLFRCLPLMHCKLPNGKRLSECFKRITISPTIYDFSISLENIISIPLNKFSRTALCDSDPSRPIPCARLDGLLTTVTDNVMCGPTVTIRTIQHAFFESYVVLLSCHGSFNETNPWESAIQGADGELKLLELVGQSNKIRSKMVVMGVCEAAKIRHSLSDEPLGFSGILVQNGVGAVLAPLWEVEDFPTSLFISKFFELVDNGFHLSNAVQETAKWFRELTVQEVLLLINKFIIQINNLTKMDEKETFGKILEPLEEMRHSFQNKDKDFQPFNSCLHWAAFQLVGTPNLNTL